MSESPTSEAKVQLLLSRSIVAGLPEEEQTLIAQTKAALRKIVDEAGEHGAMALALLGSEIAAGE